MMGIVIHSELSLFLLHKYDRVGSDYTVETCSVSSHLLTHQMIDQIQDSYYPSLLQVPFWEMKSLATDSKWALKTTMMTT